MKSLLFRFKRGSWQGSKQLSYGPEVMKPMLLNYKEHWLSGEVKLNHFIDGFLPVVLFSLLLSIVLCGGSA